MYCIVLICSQGNKAHDAHLVTLRGHDMTYYVTLDDSNELSIELQTANSELLDIDLLEG